jgi:adenylate cyclase
MLAGAFLSIAAVLGMRFQNEIARRKEIRRKFEHYVPKAVVQEMMRFPGKFSLGGERREVSIMFADIANYTAISETLSASRLSLLFNTIFTELTEIIFKHGGTLDKYIGDCVMSFFGAPIKMADHADQMCLAALEMIQALSHFSANKSFPGVSKIHMRIGVNTGMVSVGNMGSQQLFHYTVLGDAVNLASRMEGANKRFKTSILVSEFTVALLTQPFALRKVGPVMVKGKTKPVHLFELMGVFGEEGIICLSTAKPEECFSLKDFVRYYNEAYDIFAAGNWTSAAALFEVAKEYFPGDELVNFYGSKCLEFIATNRSSGEPLVISLDEK